MANEIWHSYQDGSTLYALIWRQTDDKVYDAVAGADTFDTYADADIDTYDIPLTAAGTTGDYYSVDFPVDIGAGVYRVQVMLQAGVDPDADDDTPVAQGEIYWDGSAEIAVEAMRGTDGVSLVVPDAAGVAGTAITAAHVTTNAAIAAAPAAIWATAMTDLAAGAPSATASVLTAVNYLYEAWRNRTVTEGDDNEVIIYRNDGTTKLLEFDITHAGNVFTKSEAGAAD